MKLIINYEIFNYENNDHSIELILEKIKESVKKNHLELSHFIIDEKIIESGFEEYLRCNIIGVKEVIVVTKDLYTLVNDTITSTYDYIENAVERLGTLYEAFYQVPKDESWSSLADLFEGIQWILNVSNRIDSYKDLEQMVTNYKTWNEFISGVRSIQEILPVMEEAMVNGDNILIGDLLQYEVLPLFLLLKEKLAFLVPQGAPDYVS
ncbi:hypothetical protein [Acetobacterium carbinolicum]|uniref:hypothetical protein n=1 Tax=Acetobacterium carbinolicum TaxID=52690 RepID=UPI0039C955F6